MCKNNEAEGESLPLLGYCNHYKKCYNKHREIPDVGASALSATLLVIEGKAALWCGLFLFWG